ncbi:MAG: SPFH domain-containing protein [Propionibacteriaceae bacterium]|jgi:membrane protease subunit (stomatin/prohibitin family)|nr:SPFH domain-containing protein [Propionibacteriaceae bacterium]
MGLIQAFKGTVGGALADQWLDYFVVPQMDADVLMVNAAKASGARSSNTKSTPDVISSGSKFIVGESQAVAVVDNGIVIEFTAEPGAYEYDSKTEPSIFAGSGLAANLTAVFQAGIERFKFGGTAPKFQRLYYFNLKELIGNKYGTATPIPFRVTDANIGLDIDTAVRMNGEYSLKLVNPILFYQNVAAGQNDAYRYGGELESQMKSEFMTALQPALAQISAQGVRYSAIPGYTQDLVKIVNDQLSAKWRDLRGIEMVSLGINSMTLPPDDEKMIKDLQRTAVNRDASMAAATLASAQADAMRAAASNEAGATTGFIGMGFAQQAGGMSAGNLFQQAAANGQGPAQHYPVAAGGGFPGAAPAAPAAGATGAAPAGWTCPNCGHAGNMGKFCEECGQPRPAGAPVYKCDKCGWVPPDPQNPPKFCQECGDPFNDADKA